MQASWATSCLSAALRTPRALQAAILNLVTRRTSLGATVAARRLPTDAPLHNAQASTRREGASARSPSPPPTLARCRTVRYSGAAQNTALGRAAAAHT